MSRNAMQRSEDRQIQDESFTTAELDSVRELNDWLDDPQGGFEGVPEAKVLVEAAWWATENFIRLETGKCSSTHTRKDEHAPETETPFTCQCCRYFHRIGSRSRNLISRIA